MGKAGRVARLIPGDRFAAWPHCRQRFCIQGSPADHGNTEPWEWLVERWLWLCSASGGCHLPTLSPVPRTLLSFCVTQGTSATHNPSPGSCIPAHPAHRAHCGMCHMFPSPAIPWLKVFDQTSHSGAICPLHKNS